MMLLRQELREPSVYFAILNAIAAWRTTPKAMAENVGMAVISMPKYLNVGIHWAGETLRSGKWWGADPLAKEQADIDIVMDNEPEHRLLLGECKWRNHVDETETVRTLEDHRRLIQGDYQDCRYYLFAKKPVSAGTQRKADADPMMHIVDAETMLG